MYRCRLVLAASICFSLVMGTNGQAAEAAAAAAAASGAVAQGAGGGGSPVVALITGAVDAVNVLRRTLKLLKRIYEAISPELEAIRCLGKAVFTRVTPPYLKPPWPTDGLAALTRRKRSFGEPFGGPLGGRLPPQRPFLVINGPLAPTSPPQLNDLLEEYLIDALGDPSYVEAWRDFKSSWFGVVSVRTGKCARQFFHTRFWRWVDAAP